jgi:hypothetical protein
MRTTLDIDDDVLAAARERARRDRRSLGSTLSELARAGLRAPSSDAAGGLPAREPKARYGIRPLPSRGGIVTDELVDRLRGDDAY